jgi:hypothetical protein
MSRADENGKPQSGSQQHPSARGMRRQQPDTAKSDHERYHQYRPTSDNGARGTGETVLFEAADTREREDAVAEKACNSGVDTSGKRPKLRSVRPS